MDLEQMRNEVLIEFDTLMEMIDNKRLSKIDEADIQRQLGTCYHLWKRFTSKQKGELKWLKK